MDKSPGELHIGQCAKFSGADREIIRQNDIESVRALWSLVENQWVYAKPDGWRVQVHHQPLRVNLFTRSGNDYSNRYSMVVQAIQKQLGDIEVILDAELVGYDAVGNHVPPGRLLKAARYKLVVLDLLYLDGKDYTSLPSRERITFLESWIKSLPPGIFTMADFQIIPSEDSWIQYWQTTLAQFSSGYDGAIVKGYDAPYITSVVKIKAIETLDVVVLGAYRTKENVSALLVGAYSETSKTWVPCTRISRNNAADWNVIWNDCEVQVRNDKPDEVNGCPEIPDVWINPTVVVEVEIAEWRESNTFLINPSRVNKYWLRYDKNAMQATSFEAIKTLESELLHPDDRKDYPESVSYQLPLF